MERFREGRGSDGRMKPEVKAKASPLQNHDCPIHQYLNYSCVKKSESNQTRPSSNHSYWNWSWPSAAVISLESASNPTRLNYHSWLKRLWNHHHPASPKILDLYPSSFDCWLTHPAPSTFFFAWEVPYPLFQSPVQSPVPCHSLFPHHRNSLLRPALTFTSPRFLSGQRFGSLTSIISISSFQSAESWMTICGQQLVWLVALRHSTGITRRTCMP